MTTYAHLLPLKEEIKNRSAYVRQLRNEARVTFGMDRWNIQYRANSMADETRTLLLAYGYFRGLTLEQMESPTSDPETLPSANAIWNVAEDYFRPQAADESDEDYKQARVDLLNLIEADRKQWVKTLTLNNLMKQAERSKRKAA
jgi:hypothetical protein